MPYFADTWFWVALINKKDSGHVAATALRKKVGDDIITSQLVMIEFMGRCAKPATLRKLCFELVNALASGPIKVIGHTDAMYVRAFNIYENFKDKEWSLVDCASFEMMRDGNITEALTNDKHFTQAGFSVSP